MGAGDAANIDRVARFYAADATAVLPFGVYFENLDYLTTGRTDIVGLLTGQTCTAIPIPHAFFMLIHAAVMWVVLHHTVFGRYLYAIGKNEEAARFSGIRTGRVIIAAYVICAVLTATSSIFLAMYTHSILPSSHGNFEGSPLAALQLLLNLQQADDRIS